MKRTLRTACAAIALAGMLALSAWAQTAVRPGAEVPSGTAQVDLSGAADALPTGVRREGDTVEILAAGTYRLTGALAGQLLVHARAADRVTLILDGADIENASGSALRVEKAASTALVLPQGSASRIVSGNPAALDGSAIDASAEGGAIHAKGDLTIEGEGELFVGGYLNNGVHASGNLTLSGGALCIEAVHNGVKGKDSVTVTGGSARIVCGGNGVISDAATGEGRGAVTISGGSLDIASAGDGVQAEALLEIAGGEISVLSGGGSASASPRQETFDGWRGGLPEEETEAEADVSAKGVKSGDALRVTGGALTVDALDDALHADGSIEVRGGQLALSSGDDGMHADGSLTIAGGAVEILRAYEGIEANQIAIEGGDIRVTATDDGVNANGGAQAVWDQRAFRREQPQDGQAQPRGPRSEELPAQFSPAGGELPPQAEEEAEKAEETETPNLRVTGGALYVNAEGDGLDSNGNILIEGGQIVVDGPSRSGNGAIDSGSESGGTCLVQGGTVLAIGASGMAESFGAESRQLSLCVNFSQEIPGGSELRVLAGDGAALFSHTAAKPFSSLVFSSPQLEAGDAVTVEAGDQRVQLTLTEVSTVAGESAGGRGWQRPMQGRPARF